MGTRQTLPWMVILAGIPFLQLGFSYYVSVQTVVFLASLFLLSEARLKTRDIALLALGFVVIIMRLAQFGGGETVQAVLVTGREALCFVTIYVGLRAAIDDPRIAVMLSGYARIFLTVSALLVVWQTIAILNRSYIGFPMSWFITNAETLAGMDEALRAGSRFRPTGFYGEPSYMGFVLVTFLLVRLYVMPIRLRQQLEACFLAAVAILLLRSLMAIIALFCILSIWSLSDARRFLWGICVGLLTTLGLAFAPIASEYTERALRILGAAGGGDESFYIRFVAPWKIMGEAWGDGRLLGILAGEIDRYSIKAISMQIPSIDSGIMSTLILFGVGGLVILGVLCYRIRYLDLVLIFLVSINANGSVLTYDKAVLFIVAYAPIIAARQREKSRMAIDYSAPHAMRS